MKSTSKNDSYQRIKNINLFFVKEKNENVNFDFVFKYKFYKIEKLLRNIIYLIKEKNCDNEYNVWYFVHTLQKVQDLMNECDIRIVDDFIYDRRSSKRTAR